MSGPFDTEVLKEVRLLDPPLVRVLAQVRFPRLGVLARGGVPDEFVRHVQDEYPIFLEGQEVQVTITPDGVSQEPHGGTRWQFRSGDESSQITLSDTFVSLDTARYHGRDDFCRRLEEVLQALRRAVMPPFVERLGIRYINQVTDPGQIMDLAAYVRPEVLGGLAVPLPDDVALQHSVCESLYAVDTHGLHVRWGLMPAQVLLDPTVSPVSTPSWILDLDSFASARAVYEPASLTKETRRLAERAYRYFRWVVTPRYLEAYGGHG
jgi:uncharacterized protein (TIGR04255 family)